MSASPGWHAVWLPAAPWNLPIGTCWPTLWPVAIPSRAPNDQVAQSSYKPEAPASACPENPPEACTSGRVGLVGPRCSQLAREHSSRIAPALPNATNRVSHVVFLEIDLGRQAACGIIV